MLRVALSRSSVALCCSARSRRSIATVDVKPPLAGVRVLDLTRVLSGPTCTLILMYLGAEIIKVESPDTGDDTRIFAPLMENGLSGYFACQNFGKKSVAVDLKAPAGKEVISRLIERSDVLVENFKPGTMAKFGFTDAKVKELNPDIIYTSVSGFGQSGPLSHKAAYDGIVQAHGGLLSITGTTDGKLVRVGTSMSDIIAGIYAAVGVVAALYRRALKKSAGCRLDVAMLDCTISVLENALARYQVNHENPVPLGTFHTAAAPFSCFPTKDHDIFVAAGNQKLFVTLCDLLGRQDLVTDPRFSDNAKRFANVLALYDILSAIFKTETSKVWLERLEKVEVPCSPIHKISDLLTDPQIKSRNMLVEVEGTPGFVVPNNCIRYVGEPIKATAPPVSKLGEHTKEVLRDILGYSEETIERLETTGALSRHPNKK